MEREQLVGWQDADNEEAARLAAMPAKGTRCDGPTRITRSMLLAWGIRLLYALAAMGPEYW